MNGPFSMAMLNNQRVYINKYPIVSPLKKLRRHPFFWLAKSTQLAFPATYLSNAFEGVQQSYRQVRYNCARPKRSAINRSGAQVVLFLPVTDPW